MNYKILTESSCDLSQKRLHELDIEQATFEVSINGQPSVPSTQLSLKNFYDQLRNGATVKTSAVNIAAYSELFERQLKNGNDILHISFSSALSSSYGYAVAAARELMKKYTERRILCVDSPCGSLGQGLLAELCAKRKLCGEKIDDVYAFAEKIKTKIAHCFTVGNLQHLKRGGRISSTAAVVGGLLNIRPMLCADNEGKIAVFGKVRGNRAAIEGLAKTFFETNDPMYSDSPVFISHTDCINEARQLAQTVAEHSGRREIYINDMGALMGAHAGPDSLAIFYVSKERML